MLDLYRSYAEVLKQFIEVEEAPADKPLIDQAELTEAFDAMKDIAASFDYDSLQFVFQSLDEYRLPEPQAKLYQQIKAAAAKLDWEQISSLLNDEVEHNG